MGNPRSSSSGHHATPLARLRAAAGLGRHKAPDSLSTLERLKLEASDVLASGAASNPRKGAGDLTVLSYGFDLAGSIDAAAGLHLHGVVTGDVRAAEVTVFSGGVVTGDIVADKVLVHGTIEGRVRARMLQLFPGGVLRGDVVHTSLIVDIGSVFEGEARHSPDPLADETSAPRPVVAPRVAVSTAG